MRVSRHNPRGCVDDVPVSSVFSPKNPGVVKLVDLKVSLQETLFRKPRTPTVHVSLAVSTLLFFTAILKSDRRNASYAML